MDSSAQLVRRHHVHLTEPEAGARCQFCQDPAKVRACISGPQVTMTAITCGLCYYLLTVEFILRLLKSSGRPPRPVDVQTCAECGAQCVFHLSTAPADTAGFYTPEKKPVKAVGITPVEIVQKVSGASALTVVKSSQQLETGGINAKVKTE